MASGMVVLLVVVDGCSSVSKSRRCSTGTTRRWMCFMIPTIILYQGQESLPENKNTQPLLLLEVVLLSAQMNKKGYVLHCITV
jgi:hypothetical protein